MDFQLIKQPSAGVIKMLETRSGFRDLSESARFDTIGLVQGKLLDMVVAADRAEKAAQVEVVEIKGVCPQHITMIALLGDTAAVEEAIDNLRTYFEKG